MTEPVLGNSVFRLSPPTAETEGLERGRSPVGSVKTSLVWSSGAALSRQVIQFAATIVVTRLISPHDVGAAAVALAIAGFAQVLSEFGLGAAVIQAPNLTRRFLATAFWMNLLIGVVLGGLAAALAIPIAAIYGEPALIWLIPVASLGFVLSWSAVHLAVLERRLAFRVIAIVEFTATLFGSGAAVLAALRGWGAYSLLVGPVVTSALGSVLFMRLCRVAVVVKPSMAEARAILSFAWGLVGFNTVNYWARNADNLVVAKVAGASALGFYSRAYGLMLMPVGQVTTVISRVLFPLLASVQDDTGQLRDKWLQAVRASWSIGLPLGVLMAVCADDISVLLYGSNWLPMGNLLAILALSIPPQLIARTTGALFQAIGKTKFQFWLGCVNTAVMVTAIFAGATYGARGVAIAVSAGLYATMCVSVVSVVRMISCSFGQLGKPLLPAAFAAAAMFISFQLLTTVFQLSGLWRLLAAAPVACTVYLTVLFALDDNLRRASRLALR